MHITRKIMKVAYIVHSEKSCMDLVPFLGGEAGGAFVDLIPCARHGAHDLRSTPAVALGRSGQAGS